VAPSTSRAKDSKPDFPQPTKAPAGKAPGKFKGGTIFGVGVTVEKTQYSDLEKEAEQMVEGAIATRASDAK
jgi:hypothetical protein